MHTADFVNIFFIKIRLNIEKHGAILYNLHQTYNGEDFMDRNKKYFLDFLSGDGRKNVLFEPFISRTHAETLIWRRGENLWDSPENYIDTLIYLSERTLSDVVFADIRLFEGEEKSRLLSYMAEKSSAIFPLGFGLICHGEDEIKAAEKCGGVDVLAIYGEQTSDCLPTIRMDGDIASAVERGDCGWFAPDSAEAYLSEYGDKIKILGGLGAEWCGSTPPVSIYERIEKLSEKYTKKWSCGSGGTISDRNYLELISLLGAFQRIRG